ncbi:MAG: Heavy metal transport/detoxification protein [Parcubacteria group bacterium LiPW_41]|nr:MAG: Heavy metal transport/detoxification protein [Parcubacteria group bacterium LiPW_41]
MKNYYDFMRIIKLDIKGMHCKSCELLLEEKFLNIPHVEKSEINYRKGVAEIYYTDQKPKLRDLEDAVREAGYAIGKTEKRTFFSHNKKDYKELFWGIVVVFVVYQLLKLFGITDLVNLNFAKTNSGFGVALLVGLVAGFSSCMALIGGLVLGISAKYAEKHPEATSAQKFRPHIYFNLGRIGGYALLGGLLGSIGSVFKISTSVTSFLTLFAGVVMLFVGLQLIEIFPRLSSWKFVMPKSVSKVFGSKKHNAEYNHKNSMVVGALTFFLPCGFTQAMQVYAVSSGSFVSGSIIMGLFALGTAPGLLSIGGLTSTLKGSTAKKFFKVAGIVVVLFALFNLSNSLTLAGINIGGKTLSIKDENVELVDGQQVVRMKQKNNGYFPNSFTVRQGIPVRWVIESDGPYSCAASILMRKFGISKNLAQGENVIEFTPTESGAIPFSCGMGMYTGVFNVIGKDENISQATPVNSIQSPSRSGGGCSMGRKFIPSSETNDVAVQSDEGTQQIKSIFTVRNDIQPNTFEVNVGVPVEYTIDVQENGSGCMSTIKVRGLYENPILLEAGNKIVMKFTPQEKGQYPITCAMGVVRGLINVK